MGDLGYLLLALLAAVVALAVLEKTDPPPPEFKNEWFAGAVWKNGAGK